MLTDKNQCKIGLKKQNTEKPKLPNFYSVHIHIQRTKHTSIIKVYIHMSRFVRKSAFCICENKDAVTRS